MWHTYDNCARCPVLITGSVPLSPGERASTRTPVKGSLSAFDSKPILTIINHSAYVQHSRSLGPATHSIMGEPSSPPPLDPDNQFNFTCKCLSVRIVGHISPSTSIPPCTESVDASSSSRKVYLNERSEFLVR